MSSELQIKLKPGDQQKLDRLAAPAALLAAMAKELDRQNLITVGSIQRKRLTGKGPFPVAEHKLGIVSGRLRAAVWPGQAFVDGFTLRSSIGCNVKYAMIHERGGVIRIPARKGKVRLRADRQGNLLRQGKNGRLAVFARGSHKRVKEVSFEGKAYEINMPARAPIWTGVVERGPDLARAMARSISEYLKGV